MKTKERLVWIFLTGALLGFCTIIYIGALNNPYSRDSLIPTPSEHSSEKLLSLVKRYLANYYWDYDKLDQKTLAFGASEGLYEATRDPYTAVFPPTLFQELSSDISGNIAGVGIYLQKKGSIVSILSMIPSSPASKSGLRKGDQLLSIDAIPIGNFSIDEISHRIQGKAGTWTTLSVFRPSTQAYKDIHIQRAAILVPSVYAESLSNHLRYLKIMDFNDHTLAEVQKNLLNFSEIKGLIIDLRENPGGQVDVENDIASLFLPKGSLITTLVGKKGQKTQEYRSQRAPLFPMKTPIVILIGGQTASAAEILSAALREDKRALLVGEKTFGKGSVQTIFPLTYMGESFGVKITVAHYLTPLGHDINHQGIIPDIKVSFPTISPLNQEKISFILDHSILEKILGKDLQTPLSPSVMKRLLESLKKQELSLPNTLLRRVIQEQKDRVKGKIYTVEWEFDTQLAKALELFKHPKFESLFSS